MNKKKIMKKERKKLAKKACEKHSSRGLRTWSPTVLLASPEHA